MSKVFNVGSCENYLVIKIELENSYVILVILIKPQKLSNYVLASEPVPSVLPKFMDKSLTFNRIKQKC